jgi:hypothetical protein
MRDTSLPEHPEREMSRSALSRESHPTDHPTPRVSTQQHAGLPCPMSACRTRTKQLRRHLQNHLPRCLREHAPLDSQTMIEVRSAVIWLTRRLAGMGEEPSKLAERLNQSGLLANYSQRHG